eukprot:scaffold167548_cov16-Prasinocladus_malaysianus.AAC.1
MSFTEGSVDTPAAAATKQSKGSYAILAVSFAHNNTYTKTVHNIEVIILSIGISAVNCVSSARNNSTH